MRRGVGKQKCNRPARCAGLSNVAEEERFELSDGFPSAVFKTAALSRSAIPPGCCLLLWQNSVAVLPLPA